MKKLLLSLIAVGISGASAIDQGKAFGLTTDERGLTRPARYDARMSPPTGGDFSDIGAVELATLVCTPPPGNMVSWWPGDGNAHDIQSQNNGTLEGGATFAAGEVGQAFSFNGSNQDVFIGNPANLNPTSLTIDAWINPNTVPSPSDVLLGIVTKWAESTAGDNYAIWTYVTGTGSTTVVRLYTSLVDSLGNYHNLAGGIVPLNTFSHVAMTYDSATGYQALYVNGVLVSSATGGAKPIRTTNANVYIGSEPAAGGRYFSGC